MIEVPQNSFSFRVLCVVIDGGRQHANQHAKSEYGIRNNRPSVLGINCLVYEQYSSDSSNKYSEGMR